MKYQNEIDTLFEKMFREPSMTDEQYNAFVEKVLLETEISKEELSENLEEGVKNGFSVETQLAMVDEVLSSLELDTSKI